MFSQFPQTVIRYAPRGAPASRKGGQCASPCAVPLQSVDFFPESQYTLFPTTII